MYGRQNQWDLVMNEIRAVEGKREINMVSDLGLKPLVKLLCC